MSERLSLSPSIGSVMAKALPAVMATGMASLGFAGLKFVLIGELALDFNPADHQPLPIAWFEAIVQECIHKNAIKEAITQGLAAAITLGVILGYMVNAPLAGAWTTARLFVSSGIGVGLGALLVLFLNPWLIMVLVGIAYGAACAARGKCVPLLAHQTGASNTLVSGLINTAMVLGLLTGTLVGMVLYDKLDSDFLSRGILAAFFVGKSPAFTEAMAANLRHGILALFLGLSLFAGAAVRPPEPAPIPFASGVADLWRGSLSIIVRYWALLACGGLAWGIASAASLAIFVDAVERLKLEETTAITLVLFPALGAILGNLVSHLMVRRRWVVAAFIVMGIIIALFPLIVVGYWTAAIFALVVGGLFAAGSNVVDARFLKKAAEDGEAGRGSTMMSLTHSLFIFIVGTGLAIALLLGAITSLQQFGFLAGCAILTAGVAGFIKLED